MKIGLGVLQIILLVLWCTVLPNAAAWVIFLPLIIVAGFWAFFGLIALITLCVVAYKVR